MSLKSLEDLTVLEGDNVRINPKYDSDTLYNSTKLVEEVRKLDLGSQEGLDKYKAITGEDPSNYSQKNLELRKRALEVGGNQDLSSYVEAHYNNLVDEIDKENQARLAIQYCPEKESGDQEFEKIRKIIYSSKKDLQDISEKPGEFIGAKLSEESELMGRYISLFSDEYLVILSQEARERIAMNIGEYGPEKFLKDIKERYDKKANEFQERTKKIKKEIVRKLEGRGYLNQAERVQLVSDENKKLRELEEDYSFLKQRQKLVSDVYSFAFSSIDLKKTENRIIL